MSKTVLIKNVKQHEGKYVATKSFRSKEVVCSGPNPDKVAKCASKKGVDDPVIFYVPKSGMVQIY